jgi:DNA-binding transcriptional ArsR family regulator
MTEITTVAILKSLADDTRLSLVRQLISRDCEVAGTEIISGCSDVLKLSQPTLSHHFNRLVQSGILLARKAGTEKYYSVNYPLLESIGINPAKL